MIKGLHMQKRSESTLYTARRHALKQPVDANALRRSFNTYHISQCEYREVSGVVRYNSNRYW